MIKKINLTIVIILLFSILILLLILSAVFSGNTDSTEDESIQKVLTKTNISQEKYEKVESDEEDSTLLFFEDITPEQQEELQNEFDKQEGAYIVLPSINSLRKSTF